MSRLFPWVLCSFCIAQTQAQDPFQQHVSYDIDVSLDDREHILNGSIGIQYGNRSNTSLDTIWLHLWPNAYQNRRTALCKQQVSRNEFGLHFAAEEEKGRIDVSKVRVDDQDVSWGYDSSHRDIAWIIPPRSVSPSSDIIISMDMSVKIPSGEISRLGHIGKSYQITQWYPKPAVFDHEGWHKMPYLDQGEFFSEFADFDVRITLPQNYVVGATGVLQDPSEIAWMDSLASDTDNELLSNEFPPSSERKKTLHFIQDRIHDFAWFADIRYIVRKGSVALPRSNRTVTTWSMFTPENAELWENSIEYINESVLTYSHWVGDYPYDHVTAVDGTISAGGGMEYPMITVIGETGSRFELDVVISHEVGHNWFYGVLASNERDAPWLDEGLNSFLELQHIGSRYEGVFSSGIAKKLAFGGETMESAQGYRYQSELLYLYQARRGADQAIDLHSVDFTPTNYGAMVYSKTALVFDMLLAYLGKDRLMACMNAYYDKWAFNHPNGSELRTIFEEVSGEDLSWCFHDLISTNGKFDPVARSLDDGKFHYELRGSVVAPFPVTAWNGEQLLGTTWIRPDSKEGDAILPWDNADRVRIDHEQHTLDVNRTNNSVRSNGLFKRTDPLKFKHLLGVERADREQLYWTLLPAFNTTDGLMIGPVLFNTTIPSNRTEFLITPLIGLSSGELVGAARLEHYFDGHPGRLHGLKIGFYGRRAGLLDENDLSAHYSKGAFLLEKDLNAKTVNKPTESRIAYRAVWTEEVFATQLDNVRTRRTENIYHELTASLKRGTGTNPFTGRLQLLHEQSGFLRGDVEFEFHSVLNDKDDRVSIRAFAGKFFNADDLDGRAAYFTAGQTGPTDILYDGMFIGRYEQDGLAAQQFINNMGGFRSPTSQGGSDDYLVALNMEIDVPVPIPFALFANMATAPVVKVGPNGTERESRTLYEAGIGLRAIRDVLEIWFPVTYSQEIKDEFDFRDISTSDRIRFTLDLTKLDPTRLIRRSAR